MKQYYLFGGWLDEETPGWLSFRGDYHTTSFAQADALAWDFDWYHIIDSRTGKIVG